MKNVEPALTKRVKREIPPRKPPKSVISPSEL
jgi:hypothetical protein